MTGYVKGARVRLVMRSIGTIQDEVLAARLSDYLFSLSIESDVEAVGDDGWAVWVRDEDELERAGEEYRGFLASPDAAIYMEAGSHAEERRHQARRDEAAHNKRLHDRNRSFSGSMLGHAPLTMVLMSISVFVAIISSLGKNTEILQGLFIAEYSIEGGFVVFNRSLSEITSGQVWRIITPIFIHFGLMHIVFNMLWLKDLGMMIERALGLWKLLLLVLVSAALSNLAQFSVAGPSFGGMSGVVYALLAFCWIRGRLDLTSGLFVRRETVLVMGIWFFLCLFGVMGNIANTVHTVGMGVGGLWGYVSARRVNARR